MTPLDLILWALAGMVAIVLAGIGIALAVLIVASAREVSRKKREPEPTAVDSTIRMAADAREIARAVRDNDRGLS